MKENSVEVLDFHETVPMLWLTCNWLCRGGQESLLSPVKAGLCFILSVLSFPFIKVDWQNCHWILYYFIPFLPLKYFSLSSTLILLTLNWTEIRVYFCFSDFCFSWFCRIRVPAGKRLNMSKEFYKNWALMGRREWTGAKVFALHTLYPGSIPGTAYGSPKHHWEWSLSSEPKVNPEHHQVCPKSRNRTAELDTCTVPAALLH